MIAEPELADPKSLLIGTLKARVSREALAAGQNLLGPTQWPPLTSTHHPYRLCNPIRRRPSPVFTYSTRKTNTHILGEAASYK